MGDMMSGMKSKVVRLVVIFLGLAVSITGCALLSGCKAKPTTQVLEARSVTLQVPADWKVDSVEAGSLGGDGLSKTAVSPDDGNDQIFVSISEEEDPEAKFDEIVEAATILHDPEPQINRGPIAGCNALWYEQQYHKDDLGITELHTIFLHMATKTSFVTMRFTSEADRFEEMRGLFEQVIDSIQVNEDDVPVQ